MQNRWPAKKRRATKWRQHCSTCGMDFKGPQIWGYCSKKCEVSRDGHEDPGDLPEEVIEEMMELGIQRELAPKRLKQSYQDRIDRMERSHARRTFSPTNPVLRTDPKFWHYIMDKQFDKAEKIRIRHNKEFLRTVRRLCESEVSGTKMGVTFPDLEGRVGIKDYQVRSINSSGAIAKYIDAMPPSPAMVATISTMEDDQIESLVLSERIHPFVNTYEVTDMVCEL